MMPCQRKKWTRGGRDDAHDDGVDDGCVCVLIPPLWGSYILKVLKTMDWFDDDDDDDDDDGDDDAIVFMFLHAYIWI